MNVSVSGLVLVPLIAVAAPLIAAALGRFVKIPLVVFEILLGLLLGPAVLGWVRSDDAIHLLSEFGLAMLFFLAGNEIDFGAIRGRPLNRAMTGWLISLVAGVAIGIAFAPSVGAGVFIGVALSSTALGTLMPVLRDAGELRSPFGIAILAIGAVGEFGPLLAISLFLSGRSPVQATLVLVGFAIVAGAAIWFAARGAGRGLHPFVTSTLHTSGQFAVRLVMFVLLALVALSIVLGLDMLLGAFAAGVIYRLLLSGAPERDAEQIESKLEAVGYGFLVPVFFINTGLTFDLGALLSDPRALLLVPIFVLLLIVVRGLPSGIAAPAGSSLIDRGAVVLLGATGLPIIVAVSNIGVQQGDLTTATAAALVGAGMLTVLLFPLIGLAMHKRTPEHLDSEPGGPHPFITEQG